MSPGLILGLWLIGLPTFVLGIFGVIELCRQHAIRSQLHQAVTSYLKQQP